MGDSEQVVIRSIYPEEEEELVVTVSSLDKVVDLKKRIQENLPGNPDICHLRLIYAGFLLQDSNRLYDYLVPELSGNHVIHLSRRDVIESLSNANAKKESLRKQKSFTDTPANLTDLEMTGEADTSNMHLDTASVQQQIQLAMNQQQWLMQVHYMNLMNAYMAWQHLHDAHGDDAQPRDMIDNIYRYCRLAILLAVLYLYSSFARFGIVALGWSIILLMQARWFNGEADEAVERPLLLADIMDEVGDVDDFGDNLDIGVASDEETLDQSSDLDPEIEEIRARLKEMEKEAQLIRNLHTEVEKQMSTVLNESPTTPPPLTSDEKVEADSRSVFVGNVDYGAAAEELEAHFHGCGAINRITILCDRYSGRPKGNLTRVTIVGGAAFITHQLGVWETDTVRGQQLYEQLEERVFHDAVSAYKKLPTYREVKRNMVKSWNYFVEECFLRSTALVSSTYKYVAELVIEASKNL
ncbi:ubiquitin family protein [Trichinella nativa]|uniref:MICOS complex subunit MIC13 n=1 Tax=Trichinella nativa TaxID=6335 RepID=A0A1Y3E5I4_9BILA|nr:ubiquitin family protein [Trichinella nativa]